MDILAFKLGLDTSDLSRGGKAAINTIVGIKSAFAGVARAAAPLRSVTIGIKVAGDALWKLPDQLTAIKGLMSGLALPVGLAASAETTAVGFRTLVGDTTKANAALAEIAKLAASTPFEFPELASAARSLVAFGEDSKDVASVLRRIGDVASGVNAPIGELATLYGKARVAGTLMTEDINQLLERGIPVLQEFASQTGRSAGEIKEMASQGQITFPMLERAFINLTSGAGKFSGMMDQASRTMEGRLSTLADSWKGVMMAVGEGLNEALKPLVSEASNNIDGLKVKARELGKELGASVNFGKAAFDSGKVGELMLESMKAGALFVADSIVKAMDWGASMLVAKFLQVAPFATDADKEAGKSYEETLKRGGINTPMLGITGLSEAAKEAGNDLRATVKNLRNVAEINEAIRKREEAQRQQTGEIRRKRAEEQAAKDKASDEFGKQMDAERERLFPTAPLLPAPALNLEPQGPALPARPPQMAPAAGGSAGGAGGLSDLRASLSPEAPGPDGPQGRGRIRRLGIVETMRNAYNRADKDKRGDFGSFVAGRLSSSQMRDLTAEQRQQFRDGRAGLAGTGRKARGGDGGEAQAGQDIATAAAQAVVNLLPEIDRTLKKLEAA